MIRCRECNSELTDQARFCNVCGLPQKPREPEQENSTRNGEKALDTNTTNHCENCATELPKEARFCAVCGTAQTFKKSAVQEAISNDPANVYINNYKQRWFHYTFAAFRVCKTSKSHKNVNQPYQKQAENASIRPKTVARPPVFPSRPTSNGIKPSAEIQQPDTSEPALSSEPPDSYDTNQPIQPQKKS